VKPSLLELLLLAVLAKPTAHGKVDPDDQEEHLRAHWANNRPFCENDIFPLFTTFKFLSIHWIYRIFFIFFYDFPKINRRFKLSKVASNQRLNCRSDV
jgi:hypothetical protein